MRAFRQVRAMAGAIVVATLSGCGSTHIIVGNTRPPISPDEVRIYLNPPARYEQIAILDANNKGSFALTEQQRMDVAIGRLKQDAAKLGANGVILSGAGDRYAGSIGASTATFNGRSAFALASAMPVYMKEAHGIAIYVDSEVVDTMPVAPASPASQATASPVSFTPSVPTNPAAMDASQRDVGATFGESPYGVLVVTVDRTGVAARAGIKPGDVITHIDGHATAPLYWEVAAGRLTSSGTTVKVRLLNKGGDRTLTFPN